MRAGVIRLMWAVGGPARGALVGLVRGYRSVIAPMLGPRCRFHPSCSAYAEEAVRVHGALRGSALAIWRILRCSPLSAGGIDRVPPRRRGGATGGGGMTTSYKAADRVAESA